MKTFTRLLVAAALFALAIPSTAHALNDRQVRTYRTMTAMKAVTGGDYFSLAYVFSTDTVYRYDAAEARWVSLDPFTPEYTIGMDEGALKGYHHSTIAGSAWGATALDLNVATFGQHSLIASLGISGSIIPAMDAGGWDISEDAGAAGSDTIEVLGGVLGASGRPFIVGTDPAFQFCLNNALKDTSQVVSYLMGFRQMEIGATTAVAIGTYTDFATLGAYAADFKTYTSLAGSDVTTDITLTNWVDAATHDLCVYVSAAGVTTYTIDGTAAVAAVAYTFADGVQIVPFVHFTMGTTPFSTNTYLKGWAVDYQ